MAAYTFVQAYDPTPLSTKDINALVQEMAESPAATATYELYGVRISWQLEHSGYTMINTIDSLRPQEGAEPHCTLVFTMEKVS